LDKAPSTTPITRHSTTTANMIGIVRELPVFWTSLAARGRSNFLNV
jgi:hypothetical protein